MADFWQQNRHPANQVLSPPLAPCKLGVISRSLAAPWLQRPKTPPWRSAHEASLASLEGLGFIVKEARTAVATSKNDFFQIWMDLETGLWQVWGQGVSVYFRFLSENTPFHPTVHHHFPHSSMAIKLQPIPKC